MTQLPKDIMGKIDTRNLQIDKKFKKKLKQQLLTMEGTTMPKKNVKQKTGIATLFKYNFASIVLVIAALVVVGGASALVGSNRAKQENIKANTIPESLNEVLGVDVIKQKAAQDFPEGTIVGIELEQEDGTMVYKVKFSDGSVRLYNAATGEALVKRDDSIESDESVPANFEAAITVQQARDIAQRQRPGKTISKIELETENGVVVYSVRFTDSGRVDVNAQNGSIVRIEPGDEKQEDKPSESSTEDSSGHEEDSESDSSSSDDSQDAEDSNDSADDSSNSGSSHN